MLLALLPLALLRARLCHALQQGGPLHGRIGSPYFVPDWPALYAHAELRPAQLAVVDPYHGGGLDVERIAGFRRAFPSVGLLPYSGAAAPDPRDLLQLAAAGVHGVVVRDRNDDPTSLRQAVADALAHSFIDVVRRGLDGVIPPELQPLLQALLARADTRITPAQAARFAFSHPNTVRKRLEAAGLPPLNKLIVWTRLFRAAHLLGDPGRSVENVAFTLDYASASALHVQVQRYFSASPRAVMERGGLPWALAEFRRRHLAQRWELHARRQV